MNKEEMKQLFEEYKVRIPREKQGQSECKICKENHIYSLTWTSFLYEYEEHYYCYEHISIILLKQENKQLKEKIDKIKELMDKDQCAEYCYMDVADYLLELEKGEE